MCLAIRVSKDRDIKDIDMVLEGIENAWARNKDGAGVSYFQDVMQIEKGYFDKDVFKNRVEEILYNTEHDVIIHLRNASVGNISVDNSHPFYMSKKDMALIHNGTIRHIDTEKNQTDSQAMAELLDGLPYGFEYNDGYDELIEDYIGYSKLVIMRDDGTTRIYNEYLGEQVHNVWFSNDYYKKSTDHCSVCGKRLYLKADKDRGYCGTCASDYEKKDDSKTTCAYCGGQIDAKRYACDKCLDSLESIYLGR